MSKIVKALDMIKIALNLKKQRCSKKRTIVVFIPTFNLGSNRRYDYNFYLDDYVFSLQQALIRSFREYKQCFFVVKCLGSFGTSGLMSRFVKEMNCENVIYSDLRLSFVLQYADKAIMDYPSSSMLECEKAEVPYIVLCDANTKLRETAPAALRFGTIHTYTDQSDMLQTLNAFLRKENGDI